MLAGGEVVLNAQKRHAADPGADLYFPAAQAAHGPASAPVYPPLQAQAVCRALPAGEIVSVGQGVQACEPAADL